MKTKNFYSFDLVPKISFPSTFKLPSQTYGIHVRSAKWLLQFFHREVSTFALYSCPLLLSKVDRQRKKGAPRSYCKVVSYLLKENNTDDDVSKIFAEIIRFTHPLNMTSMEYAKALWNRALRCKCVYNENILEEIFLKKLYGSPRQAHDNIIAQKWLRSMNLHVTRRRLPTRNTVCALQTPCTVLEGRATTVKSQVIWGGPKSRPNRLSQCRINDKGPRHSLRLNPTLPVRALQLPNSNGSDLFDSSCTVSADNVHYFHLCLNSAELTLHFNLVQEQLRMKLINQRFANLPGLPSCRLNQPYEPLQRTPRSPRTNSPSPVSPTKLRSSGWLQQLLYHCWPSCLPKQPSNPRQELKDRGQTGVTLRKLRLCSWWHRPLKSTKGVSTNVLDSVITDLRTDTPLNANSVNSARWSTPTSNVPGIPLNARWAVDIAYEEKPNEVGSFLCRSTYCVLYSIGIRERTLRTVVSLLNRGTGWTLIIKLDLPRLWYDHIKQDDSLNLHVAIRQVVHIDCIIPMFVINFWPLRGSLVWSVRESRGSCGPGQILQHWRLLRIFPSKCKIALTPSADTFDFEFRDLIISRTSPS